MTALPDDDGRARRPPTYATMAQARAYVAALAKSARSAPDGPAYLAMPPEAAALDRWPELRADLAALLPGVPLAQWADVADDVTAAVGNGGRHTRRQRGAYLAATHRGLIVVSLKDITRRALTRGVLAEVEAFTAAGRPVVVFTGRRLAAWPDCRTRPAPRPRYKSAPRVLDVPARPPRIPPTLDASLRALGVADRQDVARAAGLAPAGRPGAPAGDGPGAPERASAARTAPPGATFRPPAIPPENGPRRLARPSRAQRPHSADARPGLRGHS